MVSMGDVTVRLSFGCVQKLDLKGGSVIWFGAGGVPETLIQRVLEYDNFNNCYGCKSPFERSDSRWTPVFSRFLRRFER